MMRDARPLAITLAVLIGLVLLSATTVGGMMGGPMMGPGRMWGYGGQAAPFAAGGWGAAIAMGMGWLMMLAFWGALIVGVVLLVRWVAGPTPSQTAHEDPLSILQRRYAAGEIDEETYRRMRRDLESPADRSESDERFRRAS